MESEWNPFRGPRSDLLSNNIKILEEAKKALAYYEKSRFASKRSVDDLRGRVIALEYRLLKFEEDGVIDSDISELEDLAHMWNNEEFCRKTFVKRADDSSLYREVVMTIGDKEKKQLKEVLRYPKFLTLLKTSPSVRRDFFKWALHNNLSVGAFVQFPHLCERIDLLKGRIGEAEGGRFQGGEELHFDPKTKDVQILVNFGTAVSPKPKLVSLFEGSKIIQFQEGLTLTVNQIIKIFADKNLKEGPLTFYKGIGITNWDCSRLGAVDANRKGIEMQIPKIGKNDPVPELSKCFPGMRLRREGISRQEIEKMLTEGVVKTNKPLKEDSYILTIVMARSTEQITEDGSHACMRILAPRKEGDQIVWDETYAIGKFGAEYAQSIPDALKKMCANLDGVVLSPDPNDAGYTQRQRMEVHFVQDKNQGDDLIRSILTDIELARRNQFVFQIFYNNCTKWLAKKLKHYVGPEFEPFFNYPSLSIKPKACVLQAIVKGANSVPAHYVNTFFKAIGVFLGTWRSRLGWTERATIELRERKTCQLNRKSPWKSLNFYHPGSPFARLLGLKE